MNLSLKMYATNVRKYPAANEDYTLEFLFLQI